jgi:hypothetical protein
MTFSGHPGLLFSLRGIGNLSINLKITSWNSGPRRGANDMNGFSDEEKA